MKGLVSPKAAAKDPELASISLGLIKPCSYVCVPSFDLAGCASCRLGLGFSFGKFPANASRSNKLHSVIRQLVQRSFVKTGQARPGHTVLASTWSSVAPRAPPRSSDCRRWCKQQRRFKKSEGRLDTEE